MISVNPHAFNSIKFPWIHGGGGSGGTPGLPPGFTTGNSPGVTGGSLGVYSETSSGVTTYYSTFVTSASFNWTFAPLGVFNMLAPIGSTGTVDAWHIFGNPTVASDPDVMVGLVLYNSNNGKSVIWQGYQYSNTPQLGMQNTYVCYGNPYGFLYAGQFSPTGTPSIPGATRFNQFRMTWDPSTGFTAYAAISGGTAWTAGTLIPTATIVAQMGTPTHFGWIVTNFTPGPSVNVYLSDLGWGPGTGRKAPYT